jgi:hypothetical protein
VRVRSSEVEARRHGEEVALYIHNLCRYLWMYLGGGAAPTLMLVKSRGGEKGLGINTARRTDSSGIPDTKHCTGPPRYVVCVYAE